MGERKNMSKILMTVLSLLKSAIFKNKNQYNVKSKEFDILKVLIFLYICVSLVFTLYSFQYIGKQSAEIEMLTQKNKNITTLNRCIVGGLSDYMDILVLSSKQEINIVMMIKRCIKDNPQ